MPKQSTNKGQSARLAAKQATAVAEKAAKSTVGVGKVGAANCRLANSGADKTGLVRVSASGGATVSTSDTWGRPKSHSEQLPKIVDQKWPPIVGVYLLV